MAGKGRAAGGGSGGARVGAGRKPKSLARRRLTGNAGKRALPGAQAPRLSLAFAAAPVVAAVDELRAACVAPPASAASGALEGAKATLAESERAYWAMWEPLARRNGTLTEMTTPGFVLLCQVAARTARVWRDVEAQGVTQETRVRDKRSHRAVKTLRPHPALAQYRALMQRQEQLMARYGLAANGKPADGGGAEPSGGSEVAELRRLLEIR